MAARVRAALLRFAGVLDVFIDAGIVIHMTALGVFPDAPFRKILAGEKLNLKSVKTDLKSTF